MENLWWILILAVLAFLLVIFVIKEIGNADNNGVSKNTANKNKQYQSSFSKQIRIVDDHGETVFIKGYDSFLEEIICYIFDIEREGNNRFIAEKIEVLKHRTKNDFNRFTVIDIASFLHCEDKYVFLFHDNNDGDSKNIMYFCSKKSISLRKMPDTSYLKTHNNYVAIFDKKNITEKDIELLSYLYIRKSLHGSYKLANSYVKLQTAFENDAINPEYSKDFCLEYLYKLINDGADFIVSSLDPLLALNEFEALLNNNYEKGNDLAMQFSQLKVDMYNDGFDKPRFHSEIDLYNCVKSIYHDAVFQYRALWLEKQTLDIFIPSISIAIEYQGQQHYRPVKVFGGKDVLG